MATLTGRTTLTTQGLSPIMFSAPQSKPPGGQIVSESCVCSGISQQRRLNGSSVYDGLHKLVTKYLPAKNENNEHLVRWGAIQFLHFFFFKVCSKLK